MNVYDQMTVEQVCATLGIQPGCTLDDINKAWRAKCKLHHPDRGGDPTEFVKVMEAYEYLTNPSSRFKKLKAAGPDLNYTLRLSCTWEEMFYGKEIIVGMNEVVMGPDMKQVRKEVEDRSKLFYLQLPAGFGTTWSKIFHCDGIVHGDRRGDLLIVVVAPQNPRFELKEDDLITTEEVTLDMMVKGGKQQICTLWGLRTLKIKPGSKPGDEVILKKCGVAQRGNMIVRLAPKFPNQQDLKGEKWKGLKIDWKIEEEIKRDDADSEADDFFKTYSRFVFKAPPPNF